MVKFANVNGASQHIFSIYNLLQVCESAQHMIKYDILQLLLKIHVLERKWATFTYFCINCLTFMSEHNLVSVVVL